MTKIKLRLGLLHRLSLQEYLAHEVCKHFLSFMSTMSSLFSKGLRN